MILGSLLPRFQAIVPQLLHSFTLAERSSTTLQLQILSTRALVAVIEQCPQRMSHWQVDVLSGIARVWTTVQDSGLNDPGTQSGHYVAVCILTLAQDSQELRTVLVRAVAELARACPALATVCRL